MRSAVGKLSTGNRGRLAHPAIEASAKTAITTRTVAREVLASAEVKSVLAIRMEWPLLQ